MDLEGLRRYCLSLPHATEDVQWECLLFRVAGKIFALAALEPDNETRVAFKCSPEEFAELCERQDIIPQPYMARNQWVGLLRWDALRDQEIRECVQKSYEIIHAKLPAKTRARLEGTAERPPVMGRKRVKRKAASSGRKRKQRKSR